MKPEPQRVLQIAEELDHVLIERAYMRALIELQTKALEEYEESDA